MSDSPTSRRAVLTAGLGVLGGLMVSGCSDDPAPGTREPEPATPGGLSPDVAVATQALREIRATLEVVSATLARHPDSRSAIGPLVPMHRAHEATLVDAVPDRARPSTAPRPRPVPRSRDRAVAVITVREQRLHETLDRLAVEAQSGQFARLLASMGAAVHQRLATGAS